MGDNRRRRPPLAGECGEDRISSLPDELLHRILLCLGSARAAASTSVLSRRWRRVWTDLPELFLFDDEELASSFPDTVDDALAAYAAPTLEHLSISMLRCDVPAHRVAPWLRFASRRVVGRLFIHVRAYRISFLAPAVAREEAEELELPAWDAATSITLRLKRSWRLRVAGVFAVLTELNIHFARMEGRDISALVSTQCPCLKKLFLFLTLVAVSDVSIHSDSLHTLRFIVRNTQRLEVVAPVLEKLCMWSYRSDEAYHISAPKLADLALYGDAYDHRRHQFSHICRRLRVLEISLQPGMTPVMKQFDEGDELSLEIFIRMGIAGYQSFLNETNKLSTKLRREISCGPSLRCSCPLACPCRLAESCNIDNIALSSLEEVEINSFVGSHEEMEFVELLSRCNAAVLKKLVINCTADSAPPLTKEVCKKVRSMCPSSLKVKFYVMLDRKRVCFD